MLELQSETSCVIPEVYCFGICYHINHKDTHLHEDSVHGVAEYPWFQTVCHNLHIENPWSEVLSDSLGVQTSLIVF